MTRVLVIGNGAREHAIALALHRSGVEVIAHMDELNPGISEIAAETTIGSILSERKLPKLTGIDYAVIGPEAPLKRGMSDFLGRQGVPCIAPGKAASKIGTSKVFARRMLDDVYPSANPRYAFVRSVRELGAFEKKVVVENIVVKPDGVIGAKGVKAIGHHLNTQAELEKYVADLVGTHGVAVLEEKLQGFEFSIEAIVDGSRFEAMPLVRDYKHVYDDDEGPEMGSMGSYSQETHGLSSVEDDDMQSALAIIKAAIKGIYEHSGSKYKGVLHTEFMKTTEGIKVVEFNARFGDPEAVNVLSILSSSFDEVCQSIIDGKLIAPTYENSATVCIYIVPEGFPGEDVVRDWPIEVPPGITSDVYYGSVIEKEGKMLTTDNRTLCILGKGKTVEEARESAYADAAKIQGRIRYRKDIGKNV